MLVHDTSIALLNVAVKISSVEMVFKNERLRITKVLSGEVIMYTMSLD